MTAADAPLTDDEWEQLLEAVDAEALGEVNPPRGGELELLIESILAARETALRETIAQEIEALLGFCDNGHCDCTDPAAIEEAARIARGQA
jgi:hypothetical protein